MLEEGGPHPLKVEGGGLLVAQPFVSPGLAWDWAAGTIGNTSGTPSMMADWIEALMAIANSISSRLGGSGIPDGALRAGTPDVDAMGGLGICTWLGTGATP